MIRCTKHKAHSPGCVDCRRHRDSQTATGQATTSQATELSDPTSPLHQAVYGGMFYGAVDTPGISDSDSSSSCD